MLGEKKTQWESYTQIKILKSFNILNIEIMKQNWQGTIKENAILKFKLSDCIKQETVHVIIILRISV